ncbi:nickel transporter [Streptomyces sp. NPDC026672]|uniref:HoxN/HupN/NixA family nickel/cobalt transporter n=1 Tax=unclassified Streptomyces TaxID=2593676 RepID=UPI0033FD1EE9
MIPRRPLARVAAVVTAVGALVLLPAAAAGAHPLGNFTVNRYDGLVAAPGMLRVDHVEDLAEIPATQAGPDIKRLGLTEWARQRCERAAGDSALTVDGRAVPLSSVGASARLRPGQAGLHTLRVECRITAPLPEGRAVALGFHGAGASSGPGWREITARGDRTTLTASDVPTASVSHELSTYPKELLSSPADTATATVRVRPGGPALAGERRDAPAASVLPRGADRWTEALDSLVARHDLTLGFAALALVMAVGLGAMHALAPGHGKTLMAATAAARGGRARLRDVLPLAASVTVTHTLGVVALGLLVTAGSAATPSVIAWLGLASGVLVLLAGAGLVRRAWRGRSPARSHAHAHTHAHAHAHAHTHTHTHAPAAVREPAVVGAHGHHGPDDRHEPHGSHDHSHHSHGVEHTHGGVPHTHETAPTLRGTILLGFAGGLVPSPSAVVVLVGAAALGQAWFGLLLVVAYGVGLALTLTAAGFAVVKLGTGMTRMMDGRPRWTTRPAVALVRRAVPLASACLVVLLGAGLVLKGAASALG